MTLKSERLDEYLNKIRLEEPELWDIFTRKEEYNPPFRDKYGRFPYYLSKERDIFEPRVSKYMVENGLEIEYPDGKKFAVCLTHDIDAINHSRMGTITNAGKHILNGQIKDACKRPFCNIITKWNPWWNFKEIMDLEEEYGAKSTFFIMGLDEGDQDFNYRAEDLSHELGDIVDRGWEVGLHGGHEAYRDIKALKRQKANLERALGKRIMGYRNHYLRFQVPETWELLSASEFKYDATFGYADCAGFRNGMCHPFKPFDLNTSRYIDLYEIPLTIMDGTLFGSYMRTEIPVAWNIMKHFIDIAHKNNGVINILWHNTFINSGFKALYIKMLEYCSSVGGALVSGSDLII
jgi:peptidoglycan/xylan/chitin deacetylase (PgdA/CDA1 family)